MAQVGRISGPLLTENLERQGRNLKFRNTLDTTPVLWLDVNTGRIGVNYNGDPISELYIPNTARFEDLIAGNTARFDAWTIGPSSISLDSGSIYIDSQTTINLTGLGTDGLVAQNNFIKTNTSNTNLELNPSGTGTVEIFTDTWVDGNIHATGNITANGNLVLGSGNEDNIIINASLTKSLTPSQDNTYSLGTSTKTFGQIHSPLLNGELLTVESVAIGALSNLARKTGNIFYVALNGDDNNVGDHPQGPFRTLKRALDAVDASSEGPVTIHIFPGIYEEELPLTIPSDVTIRGEDVRTVIIKPAAGYEQNNVFLLDGQTSVENLTIKDFYSVPGIGYDVLNSWPIPNSTNSRVSQKVCINDNVVIIASPILKEVRVYDKFNYALLHTFSGSNYNDFGYSVAINQNIIAIGATTQITAQVNIYNINTYNLLTVLSIGAYQFDFGRYIKISGDKLAIINYQFIFVYDNYQFQYVIDTASDSIRYEPNNFDINQNYVVVSDFFANSIAGIVRIYDINNGNLLLDLQSPHETGSQLFGYSVALSDDYLLVGEAYSSRVYLFNVGSWTLVRYFSEYKPQYGWVIALNENFACVSSHHLSTGEVYVYDLYTGNYTVKLIPNVNVEQHEDYDERFGIELALDNSTNLVVAAAPRQAINGEIVATTHLISLTEVHNYITKYAFSFKDYLNLSRKSPYIQNVTVITPVNGGSGAFVDGSLNFGYGVIRPAMLFNSCTFIVPNSDGLVVTNGGLVEWLNCFTYFADRGIYVENGTVGTYNINGLGLRYGGEVRCIGSANVYGNYGIIGDGDEVLIYAINHNLAYIGSGTSPTNDPTQTIPENEIVVRNNARVNFQSQDHTGNYKVGENFLVDFGTGLTNFVFGSGIVDFSGEVDPETGEISDYNSIAIENTTINPLRIVVGDFRISNNTIETLTQEFTINPQGTENIVNFLADTEIPLALTVENFYFNGNLVYNGTDHNIFKDATTDYVPALTGVYDLGKNTFRWNTTYLSGIDASDVMFRDTYISTNSLNTDLLLKSLDKKVTVNETDVILSQNLFVAGLTTIPTAVTDNLTGNGTFIINANYDTANDFTTQNLDVRSQFHNEIITINDNVISTTVNNLNLELRTAGSGNVVFENTKVDNNLTLNQLYVNETYFTVLHSKLDAGNIKIYENVIETTESNSDLEFKGYQNNGILLENIFISNNGISTDTNNLIIETSMLDASSAEKSLVLPRGNTAQRDNLLGSLRYNTQTELFEGFYNGYQNFGGLISEDGRTKIAISNDNEISFFANNQFLGTINPTLLTVHSISVDDTTINENTIGTVSSNADLELRANGSGNIILNTFEIDANKFVQTNINDRTIFSSTTAGYYSFAGTVGVQIPHGTDAERGIGILGQLRWNTQQSLLEIFNGDNWINAEGFIEEVSQDVDDLLNFEASLILG